MVYFFWYWFYKITARLFFGYRVVHGERLIEEGGAVVASNHASFLDPPIVGIGHKKPICYLARKTLFRNRFFGWLIRKCKAIPVDQERPDATGLKMILRRLKEGNRVLIFPEGSRSWDGNLQEGQRGVGLLVAKSGVPVVPVRLFGTYEALPRGGKFLRRSRITMVVGEPIIFSDEELSSKGHEAYQRISDRIMQEIAELSLPEAETEVEGKVEAV